MKEKNLIFIFKPYRINFINKKEIENYCKKNKDENHQNIFNYFRDKEIKNQKNLNFKSQNESFKKIISYLIIRKGEKKKKQFLKKICDSFCQKMMTYNSSNEEYIWWIITFVLNLIEICLDKKIIFENISFRNFINEQFKDKNCENIGGSFLNIFQTFSKEIENFDIYKNKSITIYTNMIELILKIISNFQHKIEHVSSNLEYYFNGDFKLNFEIINNSFYPLFIHNAYLFNIENKNVFFQFLEFYNNLLEFMYEKKFIYFLPLDYIYIPLNLLRFLEMEKRKIFTNENKQSLEKILITILNVLNDKFIKNPDIKEKLYLDIQFFICSSDTNSLFNNDIIIKKIFTNLSEDINNYELKELASNMIEKFLDKMSKFYEKKNSNLFQKIIDFFKNDREMFLIVFENFNKELNRRLTNLIVSLNEYNINQDDDDNQNFDIYFGENRIEVISEYFIYFNHTLPLYSFTFQNLSDYIFNINNIEYTFFINFMMNFTNRILDDNTINKFIPIIKENPFLADRFKICFFSVIKVFFYFNKSESEYYDSFIKDFLNRNEINFHNFLNLIKLMEEIDLDDIGNCSINNFKEIYRGLMKKIKNKKKNKLMTEKEWININNNDNICILCYDRNINNNFFLYNNVILLNFIIQYLIDKDYCFMCHSIINSIKEDENIIIKHK